MFKRMCAFFVISLIPLSAFSAQTDITCDNASSFEKNLEELETVTETYDNCPKPTKDQIKEVCQSIYDRETNPTDAALTYRYQDTLWSMSCAQPGKETIEQAKVKIQKMWLKTREEFRCDHSNALPPNGNVTKFSLSTNFPFFVIEAVKKFQLDMNFKDPADGKTVLDFVQDRLAFYKESSGDQTDKIKEYTTIYNLLASKGAKHGKDL